MAQAVDGTSATMTLVRLAHRCSEAQSHGHSDGVIVQMKAQADDGKSLQPGSGMRLCGGEETRSGHLVGTLQQAFLGLLSEYIWFSDYTKYKRSIVKNWDEKGIRFIADLVNVNTGKLHSKESLEESYGVKMTVLCYRSLLKSLPETVKSEVTAKSAGPVIPLRMNLIQNHAKFPRLACSRK